jgi:glycosyltransferase involved in cell wall biosynthesis
MKVALVHEHLAQDGGAEQVLKVFQSMFPDAPTFVLVHDRERASQEFRGRDIRTSFIQKLPGGVSHYRWFLPFMPTAIERFDLTGYDLVLSSSSALAKGVITRPETLHISYCHSPTRYLWSDSNRYVDELAYAGAMKFFIHFLLTRLRVWDQGAAQRPDFFIANSQTVQHRIAKYYGRESLVIPPPVETNRFQVAKKVGNYYLTGGRLVAYKRFDIAVQAFNRLGLPLKIFGDGPEEERLWEMAKPNIEFLGRVSDEEKVKLFQEAVAFINPQEEDFGITTVEAMAAGRPVIALNAGGAREIIVPGKTGIFFDEQSWEALADTIIRWHPESFDPEQIREHALQFRTEAFREKIQQAIDQQLTAYRSRFNLSGTHPERMYGTS